MVLLRFAPSPTGFLHLGGLRTALFNHLYARKLGGKWILRIEDTDSARSVPGSVDAIRGGLDWAKLDYDFGPGRPGPHGPYFQSERLDLYHSYARKLLDSGHAYRCFCTPDRLATTRETLARRGSNASYDKACLHLTDEDVARRVRAGEAHVVRLNDGKLPTRETPDDLVFGPLKDAHASLATDPVLLKTDRFPTYHLANVVDDHEMGITHVLRGEEWMLSLPLHLDLYAALKLTPPRYAHLPLLLNKDGSKMSKRHGDVHVGAYIDRGWEPEAVLNWLALSGWGTSHESSDASSDSKTRTEAPDSTAVMSLPELVENFDLSALTHRRTVLDPTKLERLNQQHLTRLWADESSRQVLAERLVPVVQDAFPDSPYVDVDYVSEVVLALQGRLTVASDLPMLSSFFFQQPDLETPEAYRMRSTVDDATYGEALRTLRDLLENVREAGDPWSSERVHVALRAGGNAFKTKAGGNKAFMTTIRHALSGMKSGPSLADIIHVLGYERTMTRLAGPEDEKIFELE